MDYRLIVLAAAAALAVPVTAQHRRVDHGKHGVFFYSSRATTGVKDDDDAPRLEGPGDSPHQSASAAPLAGRIQPIVSEGGFRSVQVNVGSYGQNIFGDAANEPSITVDPLNPNRMAIGWRQFNNVASNFRQAGNAESTDGGQTWHNNTVLTPGIFRSDPVLDTDANGNFAYLSLQQTFYTDLFGSSNRGATWRYLSPAYGGDKQWMTIDKTNGIGRGNIYQDWSTAGNNYGGLQFTRSTDGGQTWMPPINIPDYPVWGTLDTNRSGDLVLAGLGDTSFIFCKSVSAKFATKTPTFETVTPVNLGGGIVYGSNVNPDGLMGQLWLVCDKSSGPYSGNLYMLCSVGVDDKNPCDVNFSRSVDGGVSWSPWIRVNDDPAGVGASHWFGTVAVAPSGRLDACWYDNRANPSSNDSALFLTSSYDGGLTWTKSVQASPTFNPNIGYPNQNKIGDYLGLVAENGDTKVAYSATFNGEEDIWFLNSPIVPSVIGRPSSLSILDGQYVSGKLSDVFADDGSTYNAKAVSVPGLGEMGVDVVTDYTVPATASTFWVSEGSASSVPTSALIFAYNWQTKNYDLFGSSYTTAARRDAVVGQSRPDTPYIGANGSVRILVRWLAPNNFRNPFTVSIDSLDVLYG